MEAASALVDSLSVGVDLGNEVGSLEVEADDGAEGKVDNGGGDGEDEAGDEVELLDDDLEDVVGGGGDEVLEAALDLDEESLDVGDEVKDDLELGGDEADRGADESGDRGDDAGDDGVEVAGQADEGLEQEVGVDAGLAVDELGDAGQVGLDEDVNVEDDGGDLLDDDGGGLAGGGAGADLAGVKAGGRDRGDTGGVGDLGLIVVGLGVGDSGSPGLVEGGGGGQGLNGGSALELIAVEGGVDTAGKAVDAGGSGAVATAGRAEDGGGNGGADGGSREGGAEELHICGLVVVVGGC